MGGGRGGRMSWPTYHESSGSRVANMSPEGPREGESPRRRREHLAPTRVSGGARHGMMGRAGESTAPVVVEF